MLSQVTVLFHHSLRKLGQTNIVLERWPHAIIFLQIIQIEICSFLSLSLMQVSS